MSKKNLISVVIGAVCALALILGAILLFSSGASNVAGGITVIIISLASGLIAPNPLSLLGLVAGISMLVFPPKAVGIVFIVLSVGGAVANLAIWLKTKTE